MADMVYRVSGLVTFSDGTKDPFVASFERGLLHSPYQSLSEEAFENLYADDAANVDALLTMTGSTHSLTPSAPTTNKVVTDFVMEVSGRIARDNNTWADFSVQYVNGAIDLTGAIGQAVYAEAVANSTFLSWMDAVWEQMVGAGNAVIS